MQQDNGLNPFSLSRRHYIQQRHHGDVHRSTPPKYLPAHIDGFVGFWEEVFCRWSLENTPRIPLPKRMNYDCSSAVRSRIDNPTRTIRTQAHLQQPAQTQQPVVHPIRHANIKRKKPELRRRSSVHQTPLSRLIPSAQQNNIAKLTQ